MWELDSDQEMSTIHAHFRIAKLLMNYALKDTRILDFAPSKPGLTMIILSTGPIEAIMQGTPWILGGSDRFSVRDVSNDLKCLVTSHLQQIIGSPVIFVKKNPDSIQKSSKVPSKSNL